MSTSRIVRKDCYLCPECWRMLGKISISCDRCEYSLHSGCYESSISNATSNTNSNTTPSNTNSNTTPSNTNPDAFSGTGSDMKSSHTYLCSVCRTELSTK